MQSELELKGLVGALSESEARLLEKIKAKYADQVSNSLGVMDDLFFVRFLRARNFNEAKTCKMLDKYFGWREQFNVNELIRTNFIERMLLIKEHYPHGYHGVDKLGRPIYIERMGIGDVSTLVKSLSQEQILQYYTQLYEYLKHIILPACSIASNKCVEQAVTVIDLKGFSISSINTYTKTLVQGMASMSQDYFPELLGKMIFVNSSSIFTILWSIVKPLLDSKTIKKVTVVSSKEKSIATMAELADPDQLPEFLGGTCPDKGWTTSRVGPWMDPNIINKLKEESQSTPAEFFDLADKNIQIATDTNP